MKAEKKKQKSADRKQIFVSPSVFDKFRALSLKLKWTYSDTMEYLLGLAEKEGK